MSQGSARIVVILSVMLAHAGCAGRAADKTISSTKSGALTVTLSGPNGVARTGNNSFVLRIVDSNGRGVEFRTVALRFHMAAMAGMAEMNDSATLITTGTPGNYSVKVNLEAAGRWEAIVNLQNPGESQQATMPVDVQL